MRQNPKARIPCSVAVRNALINDQTIKKENNDFRVTVRWIPGHADVHGNEEADKHAKLAAEGRHNNSPIANLPSFLRYGSMPLSISALKAAHKAHSHARWKRLWQKSPRFNRTNNIDPNLLQRSFVKLTASFPKCLTGVYMALRTQHAPLNLHLHRINKATSPHCPHCLNTNETVSHLLLDCPAHRRGRHALVEALGRKATSIPFLLSDPIATQPLVRFLNATQRFRKTFGEIPLPRPPPDQHS